MTDQAGDQAGDPVDPESRGISIPPGDPTKPGQPVDPGQGAASGLPRRPANFELAGRQAPGIYVVGWLGTLLGVLLLVLAAVPGGAVGFGLAVAGASCLGLGLVAASIAQAAERRHRPDLAYRGPSPVLLLAASVPIATSPARFAHVDLESPVGTLLSVLVTDAVWIALVALVVVATGSLAWSEIGAGLAGASIRRMLGDMVEGAFVAVPALVVTAILGAALVQLTGARPESAVPVPHGTQSLVLVLLAAAVVAPIGEELFYRGFATTAWARAVGTRSAIVRGAIFFAAVHVLGVTGSSFGPAALSAFVAFATRLPVGLALGWIFLRRRSLPASIALHATFNGLLVLAAAGGPTGG